MAFPPYMASTKEFHNNIRTLLKRQIFFLRECLQLAMENERLHKENAVFKRKFENYQSKLLTLQTQLEELKEKLNQNKKLKP